MFLVCFERFGLQLHNSYAIQLERCEIWVKGDTTLLDF